jgi:hypothetical protein
MTHHNGTCCILNLAFGIKVVNLTLFGDLELFPKTLKGKSFLLTPMKQKAVDQRRLLQ